MFKHLGIRLNLGKRIVIIVFSVTLTSFEVSSICGGSYENWLEPKIKPPNQVKVV